MRCRAPFIVLAMACAALPGCRRDMIEQPRFQPLDPNPFFPDGAASRPIPAGTVAREQLREDPHFYTGKSGGQLVTSFPAPVTRQMLERGRERYDIYCSVCHGRDGGGQGMIVLRGFPPPPSLHIQRLQEAPVGHFFDVITNGFGLMYPYASRVNPADRWAIAAYVRALQSSRTARLEEAPPAVRSNLEAMPQ
jgi:cytochrome c553